MEINNITSMEITDILKPLREAAGMSQSQLAAAAGISVRAIQNFEQGRRSVRTASAETVWKLAQALGVTMEELMKSE